MYHFFTDLIDKLPILTGVDMLSFLQEDELHLLKNQMVAAGNQDPFHHITDEVKQRIIMENIYTDGAFSKPPYGSKPGLNRRIVTKWYQRHWDVHGTSITRKSEENPSPEEAYQRYVAWATKEGLPVKSREEAMRIPEAEEVEKYVQQFGKQLQTVGDTKRQHPLKERYGPSAAVQYASTKQKFIIEGIEILADSEAQAMEIFSKQ